MSKVIVEYTSFNSNEEFVKWQERVTTDIINIAPIYKGFGVDLNTTDEHTTGQTDMSVGIFVVYRKLEISND